MTSPQGQSSSGWWAEQFDRWMQQIELGTRDFVRRRLEARFGPLCKTTIVRLRWCSSPRLKEVIAMLDARRPLARIERLLTLEE